MGEKHSKGVLAVIIISAATLAVSIALFITNFFIPLRYLSAYTSKISAHKKGTMRVSFISVGYGSCILAELPDGKTMLVDGGDGSYESNLAVLRSLNERDIQTIDFLICSSIKDEHCGGLPLVLNYKKVKTIYQPFTFSYDTGEKYTSFKHTAQGLGEIKEIEYSAGEKGDGWSFCFLSPSKISDDNGEYSYLLEHPESKSAINNASAVIWLEYAGAGFLLASDAESKVLEKIPTNYISEGKALAELKNCKVFSAGHGSVNSLCDSLYTLLKPEFSVISAGKNSQNKPSEDLIASLSAFGKVFRTDADGDIVFSVDSSGNVIKEQI